LRRIFAHQYIYVCIYIYICSSNDAQKSAIIASGNFFFGASLYLFFLVRMIFISIYLSLHHFFFVRICGNDAHIQKEGIILNFT